MIRLVNYKLSLLKIINIYSIFHILLLKRALDNILLALVIEIEPVDLEVKYKVEEILDYKRFRSQIKYLVK